MKLQTLILAAGKGTRMYSKLPKVMHSIAGKSMLMHVWSTATALQGNDIYIIYGFGGEQIINAHSEIAAKWILQVEQLGTGHAVMQAQDVLEDDSIVLVLFGDVPLIAKATLEKLIAKVSVQSIALITMNVENPYGYGRIVRNTNNQIIKIIEEKDATSEERSIKEVNTGIMAVPGNKLKSWLACLNNLNAQGEYYLTDIIQLAVTDGVDVASVQPEFDYEVLGVNTKVQLHQLERIYQNKQAETLMSQGVTIRDATRFDLRGELTHIGQDVEIDVNVIIER
ncbi:sugar phosphate nucleotidyltransferase [Methylocucumis oryzae]|uniref:sugar phosphate nucleotidyltransferase n=1 Tax=Methylocucumis oryzae TaxID=1632867 RepID=UPI00308409D2